MIPKEGPYCTYLSVILVYSVFKMIKHYYWLEFSEEFKYNVIEKNMRAYTNGDLKSFADDSDREDSHEKASDDKTGEEASDDE